MGSVLVFLQTEGRNLDATIEVIQGPDSVRQVIELNEDYGYDRPFSGAIETPGDTHPNPNPNPDPDPSLNPNPSPNPNPNPNSHQATAAWCASSTLGRWPSPSAPPSCRTRPARLGLGLGLGLLLGLRLG